MELICGANDYDPERIGKQMLETMVRLRDEHISIMRTDKHRKYVIRVLRKSEVHLLKDFLYEAIFLPKGVDPPERDIIEKPELRVYIDDFGSREGDNCLVADFAGKVVGTVWTRIMDDYGRIDDETPSFAISLFKEYRGLGMRNAEIIAKDILTEEEEKLFFVSRIVDTESDHRMAYDHTDDRQRLQQFQLESS